MIMTLTTIDVILILQSQGLDDALLGAHQQRHVSHQRIGCQPFDRNRDTASQSVRPRRSWMSTMPSRGLRPPQAQRPCPALDVPSEWGPPPASLRPARKEPWRRSDRTRDEAGPGGSGVRTRHQHEPATEHPPHHRPTHRARRQHPRDAPHTRARSTLPPGSHRVAFTTIAPPTSPRHAMTAPERSRNPSTTPGHS